MLLYLYLPVGIAIPLIVVTLGRHLLKLFHRFFHLGELNLHLLHILLGVFMLLAERGKILLELGVLLFQFFSERFYIRWSVDLYF